MSDQVSSQKYLWESPRETGASKSQLISTWTTAAERVNIPAIIKTYFPEYHVLRYVNILNTTFDSVYVNCVKYLHKNPIFKQFIEEASPKIFSDDTSLNIRVSYEQDNFLFLISITKTPGPFGFLNRFLPDSTEWAFDMFEISLENPSDEESKKLIKKKWAEKYYQRFI